VSPLDFVQRGQELVQLGQYQDAVKVCRLGLLAQPTSVDGRLVLANALMALHRYDEVLAEMRVALEVDSSNAYALTLRGEALLRKGDAAQAADVLARAADLDPSDVPIRNLLQEAQQQRVSAPPVRQPEPEFGGPNESSTKHYPAHSGLTGGPETASGHGPGVVTRPTDALSALGPSYGDTPPPEVLAVGDRSGTIEIDPDLEGIEIPDDLVDPPIDPPRGGLGRSGESEIMELRSDDLIEASGPQPIPSQDSPDAPTTAFDTGGVEQEPTRAFDPHESDEETRAFAPPPESEEEPTVAFAPPRSAALPLASVPHPQLDEPPTADYRRGAFAAQSPFESEFEEDFSNSARGKGRSDYGTGAETAPETPRARPQPETPPPRQHPRRRGRGDEMFPGDESGLSNMERLLDSPAPGGQIAPEPDDDEFEPTIHRGPVSDDMRVIRAGLGVRGAAGGDPLRRRPERPQPRRGSIRRRERDPFRETERSSRRSLRRRPEGERYSTVGLRGLRRSKLLYLYGAIAVVVVAGAVYGGLKLRDVRLDRQIRAEQAKAIKYAKTDTYAGYVKARDAYSRIVNVRKKRKHEAALARMQAAIAAEFGEGLVDAERLVARLGTFESVDAALARAYLALARSDVFVAARLADEVQKRYPRDSYAPYLKGRAALLAERPGEAAESFRMALRLTQRPMVYVGLGLAEAARSRYAEALAAFERVSDMVPGHPAATIERARAMAVSRKLPRELHDPEAELERLMGASVAAGDAVPLVSPQQSAWAALALGEVKLSRGDLTAARLAMSQAHRMRPLTNWGFTKALVDGLLRVGEIRAAEAEAERAVERWPTYAEARILQAGVLLLRDNPDRALSSLEKLGGLSKHPAALTARGRAKLAKGELEAAAKDLDAALAISPNLRAAKVARADVHLRTGNAKAAADQLKAIYDQDATPEMGVIYAAALRRTKQRDEARRILEKLLKQPNASRAYLELARLERDEGKVREARQAYGKAIELAPNAVVARREAALLALDTGDRTGAREAFEALARDAPDDGKVLVEAARVYCMTGACAEAGRLLDRAEKTTSAPRWQIARERGRTLMSQGVTAEAVAELERAVSLNSEDGETRLLLIDAHLVLENPDDARRVLKAVLKKFPSQSASQLALGRFNLYEERTGEAMTAFVKARKLLEKDRAPARLVADVNYWIGRVNYYNDRLRSAAKLFQTAVKQDPGHVDAHFFRGLVQLDNSQWRGALESFQKATELNPEGGPDAWYFMGEAAFEARKYATAERAYEKYIKMAPTGAYVTEARGRLRELD